MFIRFLAILVTGLAVIAPAAHLFELSAKITMSEDDYFAVQRIYLGWWAVGLLLPVSLILNLLLAYGVREDKTAFWAAMAAAALIALNLVIFVVWTQPVNTATHNWALRLGDWQALRRQWEYSHAVNAVVTLLAFSAATFSALRRP